jgi:CRP-like cAMP-binding protein
MFPYQAFSAIVPVPDTEWSLIADIFEVRTFKKGEDIGMKTMKKNEFGILEEGILRAYYLLENGNQKSKAFRYPGTLFADYYSILTGNSPRFTIESITKGKAWFASYPLFQERIQGSLFWQTFMKNVNAHEYLHKEQREYELLTKSAEERYEIFLKDYAAVLDQIPQYHVANYIGVDPSSLNRIIKKRERRDD